MGTGSARRGSRGRPWVWGATPAEAARRYPADDVVARAAPGPVLAMTRAVDVAAPPALTWRWLCQLALAPYSYDLVDNLGRRSPSRLVPGTERLVLGQTMATVLDLVDVEEGRTWTGEAKPGGQRWCGALAMTYAAEPVAGQPGATRIVGRVSVPGRTRPQRARATALAWGDLVMMRHQLHRLRDLAERDAAAGWSER